MKPTTGQFDDWDKPNTTNYGAGGKLNLNKPDPKIAQAKYDQHVKDLRRVESNIAKTSGSNDVETVEGQTGPGGWSMTVKGRNPQRRLD